MKQRQGREQNKKHNYHTLSEKEEIALIRKNNIVQKHTVKEQKGSWIFKI